MLVMEDKHHEIKIYDEILNGGPPAHLLTRDFITATKLFYTRNHTFVPQVDIETFRLTIDGQVKKSLSLSLADLKTQFAEHTHTITLQCAGNRRKELIEYKPIEDQLDWGLEAIGNATWKGISLADVLNTAGVKLTQGHVAFEGLDQITMNGETFGYGSSIPLEQALSPDTLLVYDMNGEALPSIHGYPLRVIVPGYIGARSVKWVTKITVQDEPSHNYFQRTAYKLFSSHITAQTVDSEDGLMLGELPVTSVITSHEDGAEISAGTITLQGYAMTGGKRTIHRVDVSSDGGHTWQQADFLQKSQPYTWCLWQAELVLKSGKHELVVRAVDSAANMQPQSIASVWNYKGYANNAWHRVRVTVCE